MQGLRQGCPVPDCINLDELDQEVMLEVET